jgi:peptide deformylase
LTILTVPDERLRQKSHVVEEIDAVLKVQIEKMVELVGDDLGLSAPQVGVNKTVFITNLGSPRVYINPVIRAKHGLQRVKEACLSIPGVVGTVTRAREIEIGAYDLDRQYFELSTKGLYAAVLQHEYDHLQGILLTDKMK